MWPNPGLSLSLLLNKIAFWNLEGKFIKNTILKFHNINVDKLNLTLDISLQLYQL